MHLSPNFSFIVFHPFLPPKGAVRRITLCCKIELDAVFDRLGRIKQAGMLIPKLVESFSGGHCKSVPPVAEASRNLYNRDSAQDSKSNHISYKRLENLQVHTTHHCPSLCVPLHQKQNPQLSEPVGNLVLPKEAKFRPWSWQGGQLTL